MKRATAVASAMAGTLLALSLVGDAFADDPKPVRIAYFGFAANNTFTMATWEGLQQAAEEAEGQVHVEFFDGKFDAQVQFNQIQDAVAAGRFDAMCISPMGFSSVVPAAEEAIAAGIKFGSLEYPVGPDATITDRHQVDGMALFVGYNVRSIGTRLAEATVAACHDRSPCKVALLMGSRTVAQDPPKLEAFEEHISDHPHVELVAIADAWWAREQGLAATQDILQAHPDLDVIASGGDQMIAGAELALNAAGIEANAESGVRLIGLGATQTAITAIREGRWFGTYMELPWEEGYLCGQSMTKAVRGEPYESIVNLEGNSPVGAAVPTKKDLDQYPDWSPKWDG